MTLGEVLEAASAGLPHAQRVETPSGPVWTRGAEEFAALAGDGASAEFRLDPAVAAAATRTPDTAPSPRGPGWVRFTPRTLDPHAVDRAKAWFISGHRRLGTR